MLFSNQNVIRNSLFQISKNLRFLSTRPTTSVHYVQGQVVSGVREYFYYVDHQGMLFLDDARMKNFTSCFKERHFLRFFFKRLKLNKLNRYTENFPFISMCQGEVNFIRAEDCPIVFTKLINDDNETLLSYNQGEFLLTIPFEPEQIFMSDEGRVYHKGPERAGGVGLIADKLAMEWTKERRFITMNDNEGNYGHNETDNGGNYEEEFGERPTHFVWFDRKLRLNESLREKVDNLPRGYKD